MTARQPDIHHQAEQLAAGLPPLLVAAERVAATVSQGVHGRRRVGQGETFWQFRRYQPGDSTQSIDWRQSAKSQPVYVRETEWEAAQSVWLWRDASPSMRYRSAGGHPAKIHRADLLLLALASLLARGGEHVALLGSGLPPAAGRAALTRLAALIGETVKDNPDGAPASLPDYQFLPCHARLVLIGDFLSPLPEIGSAIGAFTDIGVGGHLLQILDPAEETLPFSGRVRFVGPEKEGEVVVGRVETTRSDYRAEMAAHQRGLHALARQARWTLSVHRTDRSAETALLPLFQALSQPFDTLSSRTMGR
ncbi:MAG: DUF58 domain-containing protein [Rhodospirillales bacterium]|jgi:uncharacterized protein (DUF58 family)|nr:DUF58 domain-containing protein [Rhodospirillales bacterium]MDP7097914.1 DUF58 domain-containing protein [Rhodospirillales bacterium]MDP7215356.1 DUF58 domain-containing protein [Rhodospirillales bacterium]HJP54520.1 DUF58 domain-containing protein [Rhodospirillales bacterium]